MPTFKDISIYFRSDCCNKTEIDPGIGSVPLVEPMPENWLHAYEQFKKIQHLDIQEICITYKQKFHTWNPSTLYNQTRDFIQKYTRKYTRFRPLYVFFPEFNSSGVLHLHGIIYFDDANDYWTADLKRMLNNKYGRTVGKRVFNLDNYWLYINKDINKNKFTIQPFTNIPRINSVQHPEASQGL